MRAFGNGNPEVCASNLLKIGRGEVPFERVKGIDRRVIDLPIEQAKAEIIEDSRWTISTYEPRVNILQISVDDDPKTSMSINVDLSIKGEQL